MKKIIPLLLALLLTGCGTGGFSVVSESVPEANNIRAEDCDDPAKIEDAAAAIEETLARFPSEFPKIAGINKVYICEGLTSIGVPVPAAAIQSEGRTFIYLDAGARRIKASFTHELYHALEFKLPVDEEKWAETNQNEPYLKDLASPGEVVPYAPNKIPAFEPGFATDYARFSAKEDRAELFVILYSGNELTAKERAALLSDPYLPQKSEFLKKYLKDCGLRLEVMKDNLYDVDTFYTGRLFILVKPELARTGPDGTYPEAMLKAGDQLIDSGFENDGIKILYTEGLCRVYAPMEALSLKDGEEMEISRLSSSPILSCKRLRTQ